MREGWLSWEQYFVPTTPMSKQRSDAVKGQSSHLAEDSIISGIGNGIDSHFSFTRFEEPGLGADGPGDSSAPRELSGTLNYLLRFLYPL